MNSEFNQLKLPKKMYDRIESKVVELYVELHICKIPIDPFDIIQRKGFILNKYSSLPYSRQIELRQKERDAISYYDPELKTFVIWYDDSFGLLRVRFTLMHELGHIILGHKQESELAKKIADYFAAYSLVPSPLMQVFHCEDYIDVANQFDVSVDCADYCFQRYVNWCIFSQKNKPYEIQLMNIFKIYH